MEYCLAELGMGTIEHLIFESLLQDLFMLFIHRLTQVIKKKKPRDVQKNLGRRAEIQSSALDEVMKDAQGCR